MCTRNFPELVGHVWVCGRVRDIREGGRGGPQEWGVRGEKRGLRFLSLTRVWFQNASMLKRAAWPLLGVVGAWADRRRGRF